MSQFFLPTPPLFSLPFLINWFWDEDFFVLPQFKGSPHPLAASLDRRRLDAFLVLQEPFGCNNHCCGLRAQKKTIGRRESL